MAYWLFKSEPSSWSWDDQVAAGEAGTPWTGVRNHLAQKYMREMAAGDRGFFYHSNVGKAVVGIVEVVAAHHPDASDPTGRFGVVDLKAVEPLPRPVTLDAVKAEPALAEMALIKNSRLSVQPVTAEEWRAVRRLGGLQREG
jgi:predicted RNA-binding protein with PUA-like domain